MYSLGIITSFLWGAGQNLPYKQIYFYGIGPGDFVFLAFLMFAAVIPSIYGPLLRSAVRLRGYFYLITAFVGLTLISSTLNAFTWGIEGNDIVEIFRPFYYFLIVAFVALWTSRYGSSKLIIAFVCGVLFAGVVAYLNPSLEDYAGTNVLWNPNVIGNTIAIGVVLVSLLIFNGRLVVAAGLIVPLLVLAAFTFSKGTWAMSLLGAAACTIAAFGVNDDRSGRSFGKFAFTAVIVGFVVSGIQYFDIIYDLVQLKLEATQFGDSASEGGTTAARFGFAIASLQLALENPLTGVGISNYEPAYNSLRDYLGNYFWETDNPHSAWLYIVSCIGFPALAIFALIVLYPLKSLWWQISLPPLAKRGYMLCVAAVLILSGAVVSHILTHYFMWFFTGVVMGRQSQTSRHLEVVPNSYINRRGRSPVPNAN
jgi:O-antigen ligase/polysaccharide polymerase Wzy-like membrane protein